MWPIAGHKRIIDFLKNQVETDNISQSYLFIGPASLGKFTTARFFSQSLLCQGNKSPCKACSSCLSFSKNLHPDFFMIENNNTAISIETIREVRKKISLLPTLSTRRVILFEEASFLTLDAQNALLKTLEEPPSFATLILVSQRENLLPTILSRCIKLYFQPIPKEEIEKELIKKNFENTQVAFLANLSSGQIGRILKDQQFFVKWEDSLDRLSHFISASVKEKMDFAKNLNPEDLIFWIIVLRNVLQFKIDHRFISDYKKEYLEKISRLSDNFSTDQLHHLLKKIQETQNLIQTQVNQRLLFENLVLQI